VYLLDTNIISLFDPRRQDQARPLIEWMRRNDRSLSMSAVTMLEIESGILRLRREAKDKRAREIEALRDELLTNFGERIRPMDADVALVAARLSEAARPKVIEFKDLIIAATAEAHRLIVLTRNIRHFEPTGIRCLDPLTSLPSKAP